MYIWVEDDEEESPDEEVASGYFNSNYFEALYEAGASGNMEEYYIPELSGVDEWTGIERISLLQGFILDGNYTDTLELDSFQDFNFSTFPRALPDSPLQTVIIVRAIATVPNFSTFRLRLPARFRSDYCLGHLTRRKEGEEKQLQGSISK
ncbi:hypothetical protein Tcan_18461 [Toxocara canis]|uniref:Uncharacterized protein n=1 Tax=Toxocara canis TaxID=6265 RepID=A0A0B2US25_TOXCA|nr:hypothetical protein Tcan_18461 [Toxocara canis]